MRRSRSCGRTARSPSRAAQHFGERLAARISRLQLVPVGDAVFTRLPAPQDLAPLEAAMEIHQPLLEILEFAADLLQLPQVVVDLPRERVDLRLEVELLFRLAPIRAGPRGDELEIGRAHV